MDTIADIADAIAGVADGDRLVVELQTPYRDGLLCVVEVHRRGDRYDIEDGGRAVELAGRPEGWLARAQQLVRAEGMNINRRGKIFVQGFTGRDIASLAERIGLLSREVYGELLALGD